MQTPPHLQLPTDTGTESTHTDTWGLAPVLTLTEISTPDILVQARTRQHTDFLKRRNTQPHYLGTGSLLPGVCPHSSGVHTDLHSDVWGQPEWGTHSWKYTPSPRVPWDTPTGWWSQRHDSVSETLGDTQCQSPTVGLKGTQTPRHTGDTRTPSTYGNSQYSPPLELPV